MNFPNQWMTTPLGAPGDPDAPSALRSLVRTKYVQGALCHWLGLEEPTSGSVEVVIEIIVGLKVKGKVNWF